MIFRTFSLYKLFRVGFTHPLLTLLGVSLSWTLLLKLTDCLEERLVRYMNISVHCGFDASMTQQLLQNLWRHPPLDGAGGIGMPERVHTAVLDPRSITQRVQVCVIAAVLRWHSRALADKHQVFHVQLRIPCRAPIQIQKRLIEV